MTVAQLIKQLEKLRDKHGNAKVCVDYESLNDGNGVYRILGISSVKHMHVRQCDGDGFTIENKDGSERYRSCAVLKG